MLKLLPISQAAKILKPTKSRGRGKFDPPPFKAYRVFIRPYSNIALKQDLVWIWSCIKNDIYKEILL